MPPAPRAPGSRRRSLEYHARRSPPRRHRGRRARGGRRGVRGRHTGRLGPREGAQMAGEMVLARPRRWPGPTRASRSARPPRPSTASAASGARPRLVWRITPVALTTRRSEAAGGRDLAREALRAGPRVPTAGERGADRVDDGRARRAREEAGHVLPAQTASTEGRARRGSVMAAAPPGLCRPAAPGRAPPALPGHRARRVARQAPDVLHAAKRSADQSSSIATWRTPSKPAAPIGSQLSSRLTSGSCRARTSGRPSRP